MKSVKKIFSLIPISGPWGLIFKYVFVPIIVKLINKKIASLELKNIEKDVSELKEKQTKKFEEIQNKVKKGEKITSTEIRELIKLNEDFVRGKRSK